eukprot:CAMPEP_0198318912 /NCGR_PEP_ID=MMETSP1450-20131203/8145_1 /TAXON_ID=753684 ORGANISM="Madagascaria erythrocladiodes, Strain CCMP3234" /NCGR_SAMPLE_ID=MMETSP1450 /ASSEMBLY_ACC=CAM_ASM_001115 /LENGTH=137 /DNA_ID=CAMNT_0044022259 /DNA_START=13 /DNA_END=423 /DNA_ORIENTATION=-
MASTVAKANLREYLATMQTLMTVQTLEERDEILQKVLDENEEILRETLATDDVEKYINSNYLLAFRFKVLQRVKHQYDQKNQLRQQQQQQQQQPHAATAPPPAQQPQPPTPQQQPPQQQQQQEQPPPPQQQQQQQQQ